MTRIPDFTETELWVVRSTLKERYGHEVETALAETEGRLDSNTAEVAWCPALFWSQKGANFVIIKAGKKRYRAVFYYHPEHQVGTGHDSYDELGDCVVSILQVESDNVRRQKIEGDAKLASTDDRRHDDSTRYSPLYWGD